MQLTQLDQSICYRSTLRNHYLILVLVSKHDIDRNIFLFSSQKGDFIQIFWEKIHTFDWKVWEINSIFLKILVKRQAKEVSFKFSQESSWSQFLFLSRSPRLTERNSHSCLGAWDWKNKILVLVLKHEIERKKFSFLSRKLKKASRHALNPT